MSKKMTKKEFQNYIISEATKLYKIEVLKERKESIDKELRILSEGNQYDDSDNSFVPSGYYTVSNSGGYEIMISNDGQAAKVRDAFGSDNPKTSDWLEIEYVNNEDVELDDDGYPESEPVIDPNGYNIPLNQVMRA